MREFMDYVHSAFYEATGWRRDNSYAALNSTTDALLNFRTPRGLRLTLSALASPNFATSYQLGSVGVVDGSISYLFSSVPLRVLLTPQSENVPLPELLRSYRPLGPLTRRDDPLLGPNDNDKPNESLLYGRLYLPQSQLEALLVRRISPALQAQFSAVSGQHLKNGGTALGLVQYDVGKYALEGLASSDGGLLGFRGVYNFGGDLSNKNKYHTRSSAADNGNGHRQWSGNGNGDKERIYGRFSTGGEIYYGTLNKSGGISLGARFATLPDHRGTPLSATLTLNPLMGNIAASYAVMAGKHCSLATRMQFNVFSYESSWAVGMELWRKPFAPAVLEEESAPPESPYLVEPPVVADKPSFDAHKDDGVEKVSNGVEEASNGVEKVSNGVEKIPNGAKSTSKGNKAATAVESNPNPQLQPTSSERSFQAKLEWRLDDPKKTENRKVNSQTRRMKHNTSKPHVKGTPMEKSDEQDDEEEYAGVLKARLDQNLRLGVLWEGRLKSLLFSLGSGIDLRNMDKPFRTLGLEIQFSS